MRPGSALSNTRAVRPSADSARGAPGPRRIAGAPLVCWRNAHEGPPPLVTPKVVAASPDSSTSRALPSAEMPTTRGASNHARCASTLPLATLSVPMSPEL